MKKILKKLLKILLIVIILIIALMIIVPYFFKDALLSKVKEEINKNVNAKVEFTDFKLSLFRSFPQLNLALINLTVCGIDKFEEDTLMSFQSFNAEVDILSAIKGNVKVKGIVLDKPVINAIVLKDSTANWDIVPETEIDTVIVEEVIDTVEASGREFKVELRKFEIRDAVITYIDSTSDMKASIENLDFLLSGNLGMSSTNLNIVTSIEKINVVMDGIKFLKNASFNFDAEIGADLEKGIYTFKENNLALNDIELGFEGVVKMPEEDIDVDVKFKTKKTSFKSLLSMVPAIYMQDFSELETKGQLILEGNVKGIYSEQTMPSANIKLLVNNAMFKYPDLPESVDNINVDLSVLYDGVNDNNTKIDLNTFHLELASNPFDMSMHIRTPMTDPYISGNIMGEIVLNTLADAIPLEDMSIAGKIFVNLNMDGNMSLIENEMYEDFKADGEVKLNDFVFTSSDLPQTVFINNTVMNFTPQYLQLKSFECNIGQSDFNMSGKIDNYLAYVFNDEIICGNFDFYSSNINANEFLAEDEDATQKISESEVKQDSVTLAAVDTAGVTMSVFEVPANVNFILRSKIDHILYDKLDIENLKGTILIKDSKVNLDGLSMNLLDGYVGVNGEYNTQDSTKPAVTMGLDIRNMEIQNAVKSFSMLDSLAPILKNCKGKISLKFDYISLLDSTMSPVLNSVDGYGRLQSDNITVVNVKTFDKIAGLIKLNDKFNNSFKDVNVSFTIKDGRITIKPFDVKADDIKIKIGGSHGIDQTMDYDIALTVPREKFGAAANAVMNNMLAEAAKKGIKVEPGKNVNINLRVYGDINEPKIGLTKNESDDATNKLKDQINIEIKKKGKEEVAKQAQKLIDDAEKKAAKIKRDAQAVYNKSIIEADKKAATMIKEGAKNGLFAKVAAEAAAKELKKSARKEGSKILKKANDKADNIVKQARIKAENTKNE